MSEYDRKLQHDLLVKMSPEKEMKIKEILCGSDWDAGQEVYDFLHRVRFNRDGTGIMESGGGQRMMMVVNFSYTLLEHPEKGDVLAIEYHETIDPDFGLYFKPTEGNQRKEAAIQLQEEPVFVDEPYIGKQQYMYTLHLSKSPFPTNSGDRYRGNPFFRGDPNKDEKLLTFYGYHQKEKVIPEYEGENVLEAINQLVTPEVVKEMKDWWAYKSNSTAWIVWQRLSLIDYEKYIGNSDVRQKVKQVTRIFRQLVSSQMSEHEQQILREYPRDKGSEQLGLQSTEEVEQTVSLILDRFKFKLPLTD